MSVQKALRLASAARRHGADGVAERPGARRRGGQDHDRPARGARHRRPVPRQPLEHRPRASSRTSPRRSPRSTRTTPASRRGSRPPGSRSTIAPGASSCARAWCSTTARRWMPRRSRPRSTARSIPTSTARSAPSSSATPRSRRRSSTQYTLELVTDEPSPILPTMMGTMTVQAPEHADGRADPRADRHRPLRVHELAPGPGRRADPLRRLLGRDPGGRGGDLHLARRIGGARRHGRDRRGRHRALDRAPGRDRPGDGLQLLRFRDHAVSGSTWASRRSTTSGCARRSTSRSTARRSAARS